MKRQQWIVFGLAVLVAGICGQMTAFALNAVYDTTQTTTFKLAGTRPASATSTGIFTFNNDGTYDLVDGADHYTGTYALVKKGKQVAFALDDNGMSLVESVITDWIQTIAADAGVSLSNLSLSIKKVTITNATIKNGNPVKATLSVSGKASANADGKFVTRSFTYKSVVVF